MIEKSENAGLEEINLRNNMKSLNVQLKPEELVMIFTLRLRD
jgi:hypothetical protein